MLCSCGNSIKNDINITDYSKTSVSSEVASTIDDLKSKSASEIGINETVKTYLDKYAFANGSFDPETNGYILNCSGCDFWSDNEIPLSEIFGAAKVYCGYGLKITGLYIELPAEQTADISVFPELVFIDCMSRDISGLTCADNLDNLKSFVLRYVQGQPEEALINVCKITEKCPNIEYIFIEGLYTDEYPALVEYLKGKYDIEVYDEGLKFEKES